MSNSKCFNVEYDVALSFAGEDREYVDKVATSLLQKGIRVFYDKYEQVGLWGKDLYQHLDRIYQHKAKYTIVFISQQYNNKLWTNHELKSAQARAFTENEEYILPVRFDNTEIPGIRPTIGYLDLKVISPEQLADLIAEKLGKIEPENFIPNDLEYLVKVYPYFYDEDEYSEEDITDAANYIFHILSKLNDIERKFLAHIVKVTCQHNIVEDVHEDIKNIERETGLSKEEIIDILNNLCPLGFEYSIRKSTEGSKKSGNLRTIEMLHVKFENRNPKIPLDNLTGILVLMYDGATDGMCTTCSIKTLTRLDFSRLNNISEETIEELESQIDYDSEEEHE